MTLEDLQPDATVRGILPDALVTVVSVTWHGSDALTIVYRRPNGRVADEILYRRDEPRLMEEELSVLLEGRRVDLRTPAELSRYFRNEVLQEAEVQYVAR